MEKFRKTLDDIQLLIDNNKDASISELKQLWNNISFAITDHEQKNELLISSLKEENDKLLNQNTNWANQFKLILEILEQDKHPNNIKNNRPHG